MDGYIKLPRSLLEWEWFGDPHTLKVYIKLLFTAVFRDCRYKGYELKRGQLLTTIPQIAALCGLSIQQTRTALEHLKSTDKITVKTTNKFSIITLIEYDCDFENNSQNNSLITDKQQTTQQSNNRPTILQEENKELRNQENAHTRESVSDERFDLFWAAYPKKQNKGGTKKVWAKIKPTAELFEKIMAALELAKQSEQWRKDNGQFIPYPSTWLNGERWEDDYSKTSIVSSPAPADFDPDDPYADWR